MDSGFESDAPPLGVAADNNGQVGTSPACLSPLSTWVLRWLSDRRAWTFFLRFLVHAECAAVDGRVRFALLWLLLDSSVFRSLCTTEDQAFVSNSSRAFVRKWRYILALLFIGAA